MNKLCSGGKGFIVVYEIDAELEGDPENLLFQRPDKLQFSVVEIFMPVRVVLCGDNTHPPQFWFELLNHGRNGSIDLREIDSPKSK